jgi:hypothetical protein
MKNRKGFIELTGLALVGLIAAVGFMGGVVTKGTIETAQNGQLKKNGQSIWAHMLNQCGEGSTDARCMK